MAKNQPYAEISPLLDPQRRKLKSRITKHVIGAFMLSTFLVVFSLYHTFSKIQEIENVVDSASRWTEQEPISPEAHPEITKIDVEGLFKSAEFRDLSVERLQGAVRISTETLNNAEATSEDDCWDMFFDFARYLRYTFPSLHEKLGLKFVNTHGLVYTWEGSDSSLEPILLTGHQDVIPVVDDDLHQWKHHPFSGYFDGTYIYGRGSHDSKNNVVAILASITALLEAGFAPRRTFVIVFEFDRNSATDKPNYNQIVQYLEKVWGQESFALVLDAGLGSLELPPTSVDETPGWKYLSGVIKHVFHERGTDTIPTLVTDIEHYQNFSDQIYQFTSSQSCNDDNKCGSQITNEKISIDAHLESILFYHEFIRVFDEANLEWYDF